MESVDELKAKLAAAVSDAAEMRRVLDWARMGLVWAQDPRPGSWADLQAMAQEAHKALTSPSPGAELLREMEEAHRDLDACGRIPKERKPLAARIGDLLASDDTYYGNALSKRWKENADLSARLEAKDTAIRKALAWLNDPRKDANETFERIAKEFHRDTGFLRPGKDEALAASVEEGSRTMAWVEWCKRRSLEVLDGLRAALSEAKEEPREFPVTDPEDDAPDGAIVDGYERVGSTWHKVAETKEAEGPECDACGDSGRLDVLCIGCIDGPTTHKCLAESAPCPMCSPEGPKGDGKP